MRHLVRPQILASGLAVLVLAAGTVARPLAQQPAPNTEIFLLDFDAARPTAVSGAPLNVSNNGDYDNQPSFLADGSAVLFTSKRDGKQTDIYRYTIASKQLAQLTHTDESEYSPIVTPDGKTFSVIRVEADGTQRLWRFDLDGANPRLVLTSIKPVGYHAWIDATHLALFILGAQGQPATLQIADTATDSATVVEPGIGRSILIRPHAGVVSFVSKPRQQPWTIELYDPKTRAVTAIGPTVEGSEDVAWDPATGQLVMGKGSKLFARTADATEWREIADVPGVANITRLAIAPNGKRIAIVAEPHAGTRFAP
jgi:dipeptidyl aminopeptidase/acylaminoacyl peptidase